VIILDTNVLPRHGSLAGPTVALVRAIAQKTGHDVALPAIVVEEAVAELDRDLKKEWSKARAAADALARFFPGYRIRRPDLATRVQQWRTDLEQSFTILDSPAGAADEALRREAHRISPSRAAGDKGIGARDTLIWLTVLEAHRQAPASGATYFVTNNAADFGRDGLLPPLQEEIDGVETTASFHYLTSMAGLLDALATPAGDGPTAQELLASDELRSTVEKVLGSLDLISEDYWQQQPVPQPAVVTSALTLPTPWDAYPSVTTLRPAVTKVSLREVVSDKAYEVGGHRFAAVTTVWDGVVSTSFGGTGMRVSYQYQYHYLARLLLLVELGEDGRVKSADVAAAEPFVYDRTETRTIG
jgi:PIN domain